MRQRALDLVLAGGLIALGAVWRLRFWGGIGLADDHILWNVIQTILRTSTVNPDNQGYRVAWWLPTAVAARLLGLTETAMVLPSFLYSLVGIGLVFAFARWCFGRWAAVTAALLLAVHPMDVAWSTLVTNDFALSVFAALAMYAVVRATDATVAAARRRWWMTAGVATLLAYHSKVTGLLLLPAIAGTAWSRRGRLDGIGTFIATVAVLLGASGLLSYALVGTPFGPMHSELVSQFILVESTAAQRQVRLVDMLEFPSMLFVPNHLGVWLNALYPHALVVLVLLAVPLRLRTEAALWWWLLVFFLGMEFNLQRVAGYWVTGFRNMRHAHVFAYPIVLLVAGYLAALRARFPRIASASVAALAVVAALMSVRAGTVPHVAYADSRAVCAFAATSPEVGTIWLDDVLRWRCQSFTPTALARWTVRPLPPNPPGRPQVLAEVRDGWVVTGGGREPMYGGTDVIPLATELPVGRGRVVLKIDGPIDPRWRAEPLRIWRFD